jgi:hypothetical protein
VCGAGEKSLWREKSIKEDSSPEPDNAIKLRPAHLQTHAAHCVTWEFYYIASTASPATAHGGNSMYLGHRLKWVHLFFKTSHTAHTKRALLKGRTRAVCPGPLCVIFICRDATMTWAGSAPVAFPATQLTPWTHLPNETSAKLHHSGTINTIWAAWNSEYTNILRTDARYHHHVSNISCTNLHY